MAQVDAQTFMDLMSDKKAVVSLLLEAIETTTTNTTTMNKLLDALDEKRNIDKDHALKCVVKCVRQQQNLTKNLTLLMLCYASGDSLASDAGKAAMKLGVDAQEVLRTMMQNKFK